MRRGKATRQQIRRHNRQLVLQAIYDGAAESRVAVAQQTRLAKPTVSGIIAELIEEGLLEEGGRGQSTDIGGKRPTLLKFVPEARQAIGVSVNIDRVLGVLSNLDGQVVAEHYADLTGIMGEQAINVIQGVINGLRAQLDAPLLCIGIGVPGIVDVSKGVIRHSAAFGWRNVALAERLRQACDVPVWIDNNTELAAIAQSTFLADGVVNNLVLISINRDLEIGVTLGGGTYHFGNDIGFMPFADARSNGTASSLQSFLGWSYVQKRIEVLREQFEQCLLPPGDVTTYLDIRYGASRGDLVALALREELAGYLAQLFTWIIGLLRPDHVALGGAIVDLGQTLLDDVASKVTAFLDPELDHEVTFSLAEVPNMGARGAVARTIRRELGIL